MSRSTPAVTWCVINYNGARHLEQALEALAGQDWAFDELLLIDNGSTDDSLAVAAGFPRVKIVRLDENRGPGAARNRGLEESRNDLILFQDNDVRLERDTMARLEARLRCTANCLAVAPRVLYAHAPQLIQFDSADCHFLGLMATRNADVPVASAPVAATATTSMVTACFLFDRSQWRCPVFFDETMAFNLEDHDFGVRASLAGYGLWVEPAATAVHGSGTPGLSYRPGRTPSGERLYHLTLNRWVILRKCWTSRTALVLAPALVLYELAQLTWLVTHGQARTWLRAARSFVGRWGSLAPARREIQAARRAKDSAVLRDAPLPLTDYVRGRASSRCVVRVLDWLLRGYWRTVRGLL